MPQPITTTQPAQKRTKNFKEVSLGYPKRVATEEARRCPQCADPVCMKGCPIGIDIPEFIRLLREGSVTAAYEKIKEQNCLPSICGRICSAPCEAACILTEEKAPIGIRALERYASDYGRVSHSKKESFTPSGKKVAIIGSGPSGLAASVELAKKGHQVAIFEALDKPGGVLRYGIPEFRIPKKVLDGEINDIKAMGIGINVNYFAGQTGTLEDLFKDGFSAILLATGAGMPKFMDLAGANLGRVYYGEEFLMRVNLIKPNIFSREVPNFVMGENIAVIGSGNTALDCARAAVRFGKKVTLIFRRTEDDMRVGLDERKFGKEEDIIFESLVRPKEILGDQNHFVCGLKCIRMDFADSEGSGQWQVEEVPGSEFILNADTVIIAIGHKPNSLINKFVPDLKINRDGTIQIDEETGMTSIPNVFATGNVITNAGPVVEAIALGKEVANLMDKHLKL